MLDIDKLLTQYRFIEQKYSKNKQLQKETLTICISPTIGPLKFAKTVKTFHQKCPDVKLNILEADDPSGVLRNSQNSKSTFGITTLPDTLYQNSALFEGLTCDDILTNDRLCLLERHDHPFARRATVSLAECLQEPLAFDNTCVMRHFIETYDHTALNADACNILTESNTTNLDLIHNGLAVGSTLRQIFRISSNNKQTILTAVPIENSPSISYSIVLHKNISLTDHAQQFIDIFKKSLSLTQMPPCQP